MYFNLHI